MKILIALLIFFAGAATGYALSLSKTIALSFALRNPSPINRTELACKSAAQASLFRTIDRKAVEADAGPGTDEVAIKIDRPGSQISVMTRAGLRVGFTEADQYPIVFSTTDTLLAAKVEELGALNAFLVKTDAGQVMWTKVAHGLLSSQAVLLECY